MRDYGIVAILPLLIYASLRLPYVGCGLWLWTSAFNINQLVYGFAKDIKFAKLFAGLTIVSFFISKENSVFKFELISWLVLIFFIIATISNILCIGNEDQAWNRWGLFAKIILFYFFTIAIVHKKIHIDLLCWMLIISIGALSAAEGTKFLISGGAHRIPFLAGISGDNNFFGVMIVTVIPIACYLFTQAEYKYLRLGLIAVIFFMILGVFSTFSRGAFLGLSVFAFSFWKNSNKKLLWLLVLIAIIFSLNNLMPDAWLDRMNSVEDADKDSSFMGRVIAWKIATLVAMDNFWGGGFRAVQNMDVWLNYSTDFYKLDFIKSPPVISHFKATHSAYFQVLSNHGFIGLFFFLIMLLSAYFKLSSINKYAQREGLDPWIINLSKMLNTALISYCCSAAAVNVAYFDFLYAILAITARLNIYIKDHQNKKNVFLL